jgi:hypothetical protein
MPSAVLEVESGADGDDGREEETAASAYIIERASVCRCDDGEEGMAFRKKAIISQVKEVLTSQKAFLLGPYPPAPA